MKRGASDPAQKATPKCRRNRACLEKDGKPQCQIENCVNGSVHFLECLKNQRCADALAFGLGHRCTCPIRKELFSEHRI